MARRVLVVAGLACLAFLAVGCGAGSTPASVANLGTTSSTGATASASSSSNSSPSVAAGSMMWIKVRKSGTAVKYAACMRSHGLPNYPDPDSHGEIRVTASTSLDPNSPVFQTAQADCQHLLPAGTAPSPGQQLQIGKAALAFAACMRTHGVPNYPDPTTKGGAWTFDVDPNSPSFQAAQKTCQSTRTDGSK